MDLYEKKQKLLKIKLELEKQLQELENFININDEIDFIKEIYNKLEENIFDLQNYLQFLE